MYTKRLLIASVLCLLAAYSQAQSAPDIIKESGVKGGLVVHLGPGDGKFTAALRADNRFIVHGLYRRKQQVNEARNHIRQLKRYGAVSVQHWDKSFLPYADNLVNLVVVEDPGGVPMKEITRVLTPLGAAMIKSGDVWKKVSKPWPGEIDEWTHYLHGPDNNAVAQDTRVGLPTRTQWIGAPKFARSHEQLASLSAMVTARGRIFYVIDEGLTADIRMPARWRLIARDAFNGVVLWKRKIEKWSDHLHSFRSGPPDLPFRLVARGDRVYVTLGLDEPVTALDAATGKTVLTFKGTESTRQIVHTGKSLIMLSGTSQVEIHMRRRGKGKSANRVLLAADPETGDVLWRKEVSIGTFLPVVVSGDSLLYQTHEHLMCLKLKSGTEKWSIAHPCRLASPKSRAWNWASPTLVANNGIVYVADFRKLSAFSIEDGKTLWNHSSAEGFASPPDVFVINDLVWRGYTHARGRADFGEGLDAGTGKLKRTIDTKRAWKYPTLAHHRCYRPKATTRFILASRSGVEFINVRTGKVSPNHWVRGTCQYGVMPANGLLYAPPHSCACNIKTMVRGIYAFAASPRKLVVPAAADARLQTGDAFGKVPQRTMASDSSDNWPTFRHDNERSARSTTVVPDDLQQTWKTKIGGRLSSPVAAWRKVFVASVDAHTVHALDAADGRVLWSYTAGGRIDSPPTAYRNMVLFGSADGWVYCLRESDGALVWRFRGAPAERLVVVRGQLESAWPVHGSVLVHEDTVIAAAGRSSYLDGGIHVYRLDPKTGKKLSETVIHSLGPKTGDQPEGGVDLRGVLNDVLAASGKSVYMRHLKINFKTGDDLEIGPPHLFAPMGFLDDRWWHRSYWIYGSDAVCMTPVNESGWQIWPRVGNMLPSGRMLCLGDETVFGYGRDKYPGGMTGQIRGGEKYRLFAAEKKASAPLPSNRHNQHLRYSNSGRALGLKVTERDKRHGAPSLHRYLWSRPTPIFVRALALADKTLILAGPPEPVELRIRELKLRAPFKAEAAFLGRQGASVRLVSAADGKELAERKLECSPVFDGMIAAYNRIFISLENGAVVCLAK